MTPKQFHDDLNEQFGLLVAFARRANEVELAGVLFSEFRGMQSAGWSSVQTAHEAFEELSDLSQKSELSKPEYRQLLCLYAHLSEAGGVYESVKNLMGILQRRPLNLWPFRPLVKVKNAPKRVIGPNSNAMFRDMATQALEIGMPRLSQLIEIAFRDDIRNGISHADYVLWSSGLRLPQRNGGVGVEYTYEQVSDAVAIGATFFELFRDHQTMIGQSFNPAREVFGRFSQSPPCMHTIGVDSKTGGFSISSRSPHVGTSPEYDRQERIRDLLGGRVIALYPAPGTDLTAYATSFEGVGLDPHVAPDDTATFDSVLKDVDDLGLWAPAADRERGGANLLCLTPWGFRWLCDPQEVGAMIASWPSERIVFEEDEE